MAETIVKGVVKAKVNGTFEKMHPETEVDQVVGLQDALENRIIRNTLAGFVAANTVLEKNVIGYETDTGAMKIGDGETNWVSLPYATNPKDSITSENISDFNEAVNNAVNTADGTTKGVSKLYTGTGQGTDGAMTQKAITDALANKLDASAYTEVPAADSTTAGKVKLYTALGTNNDGAVTQNTLKTLLDNKTDLNTYNDTKPIKNTRAGFKTANTILNDGQFGIETDAGGIKVGDGSTKWNNLSYIGGNIGYQIVE